jgi:hypothetical protein
MESSHVVHSLSQAPHRGTADHFYSARRGIFAPLTYTRIVDTLSITAGQHRTLDLVILTAISETNGCRR